MHHQSVPLLAARVVLCLGIASEALPMLRDQPKAANALDRP